MECGTIGEAFLGSHTLEIVFARTFLQTPKIYLYLIMVLHTKVLCTLSGSHNIKSCGNYFIFKIEGIQNSIFIPKIVGENDYLICSR